MKISEIWNNLKARVLVGDDQLEKTSMAGCAAGFPRRAYSGAMDEQV